jgi:hypothetical protein
MLALSQAFARQLTLQAAPRHRPVAFALQAHSSIAAISEYPTGALRKTE